MVKKKELLDVVHNNPKTVGEKTFEDITDKTIPSGFAPEVSQSVAFCAEEYDSEKGISSCVASEVTERSVDRGVLSSEDIKDRIEEVGGTDELVDVADESLKGTIDLTFKGFLNEFEEER